MRRQISAAKQLSAKHDRIEFFGRARRCPQPFKAPGEIHSTPHQSTMIMRDRVEEIILLSCR